MIIFDADDTLWHNMNAFSDTHKQFADLLQPYLPEDAVIEQLEATEYKNIPHFGYGVKGFTLSMIETAIEITQGKVSGEAIGEILEMGKAMLAAPVALLDGVVETLEQLAKEYPLAVITKGDLFNQETKVARSGLADHFQFVEVVSEKNPETYAAIFEQYGLEVDSVTMIGNSLKSDVLPVLELGARAVHIPYELTWVHEEAVLPESLAGSDQFRSLRGIRELPKLLKEW